MSMMDESHRYYIENGNLYHYTPSNLYLSAGFYTGTDAIRQNLGDIHKNKEKMRELVSLGFTGISNNNENLIDCLNAHHFDYRGLIERGLAIEVTKENNPYEN